MILIQNLLLSMLLANILFSYSFCSFERDEICKQSTYKRQRINYKHSDDVATMCCDVM